MKLKTMNDISIQFKENMGNKIVEDTAKWMEYDIKQEAIKWVKKGIKCGCKEQCLPSVATMKDFFNITEEDLK